MTYKPKLPLWPDQKNGLAKMKGREAFFLAMAMRTGKSATDLTDFGIMEDEGVAKDHLIIAPGGVYKTWMTAIQDYCSDDLKDRMAVHMWQSGPTKGERRKLESFMAKSKDKRVPRTLLMNVEALSRPGEARLLVREFLEQRKKLTMTTIDESTCIKNSTKRTQFVNKIIRPRSQWRRLLSGLPTPRSPLDLYYQYEFLDPDILGFGSWYAFRAWVAHIKLQYLGGRTVQVIDQDKGDKGFKPEAIKELNKLIEPHSFRVEFRPKVPSTWSIREVELTKEQKKHYAEIRDFATTQLANSTHVTATVVIAQIMRLHQILCGHVRDDDTNTLQIIPENRTSALLEELDDYGGKAVIWASYDHDIRKIALALERHFGNSEANAFIADGVVARFWGGNEKSRESEKARFLVDPKCRYMVATPDAGRYGQTWDVADLAIYYSSKDNLDHREQSEQRTMGKMKTRGVDNIDLIAPNTVEMKILQSLRMKINMASAINGDSWREWLI